MGHLCIRVFMQRGIYFLWNRKQFGTSRKSLGSKYLKKKWQSQISIWIIQILLVRFLIWQISTFPWICHSNFPTFTLYNDPLFVWWRNMNSYCLILFCSFNHSDNLNLVVNYPHVALHNMKLNIELSSVSLLVPHLP